MSAEWQFERLGDHISLKGGLSYNGRFINKGNALLVGMGAVSYSERFLLDGCKRYGGDYSDSHRLNPGDLVIATRQQSDNLPILGFPAMIPASLNGREVLVATNLYKVTNDSRISNRFLYWLLRGREYRSRILSCSKGTTVRMITKDAIEDFRFLCPPENERTAIVTILDSLDDKIDLNRKLNETLEAMARALFKSWFVDFDPVRKKQAGQPTGMPPEIDALVPSEFEDSALGQIPKGWRVGKLGDVSNLTGSAVQANAIPSGTPFVGLEHIPRKTLSLEEWGFSDEVTSNKTQFAKDQILFGKLRPYFHKVVVSPFGGVCSTDILVIGAKEPVFQGFAAMHFSSEELVQYADAHSGGTKMPRTNWGDLANYEVVLPPPTLGQAFNQFYSNIVSRMHAGIFQNKSLAAQRDTLLPKLISGELRVKDAERFVGGAL